MNTLKLAMTAFLLVGCVNPAMQATRQAQADAQDGERCGRWGISADDPRYAQCMALLYQQRMENDRASAARALAASQALQATGMQLMMSSQPQTQRLQTTCTRTGNFVNCW